MIKDGPNCVMTDGGGGGIISVVKGGRQGDVGRRLLLWGRYHTSLAGRCCETY